MPKRGNVIDPETAELIKNVLLPPQDWDTRPVLWPASKVDDILETIKTDAALIIEKDCQRNLAHFVCLDEIVRLLIVRARMHNNLNIMAVDDLFVPYDFSKGGPIHVVTRFLMGNDLGLKSCLTISPDNRKVIESGGIKMFRSEDLQTRTHEDRQAVAMARVLEYYAFSPYTTYKQRPTIKQAMNADRRQADSTKSQSAIEVVHLRIPKKPEKYEPTGKHINIRYTVTEHLRRQPTKAGIKLIVIPEHKRGPIGAPEKPKRVKVYKVVN